MKMNIENDSALNSYGMESKTLSNFTNVVKLILNKGRLRIEIQILNISS